MPQHTKSERKKNKKTSLSKRLKKVPKSNKRDTQTDAFRFNLVQMLRKQKKKLAKKKKKGKKK